MRYHIKYLSKLKYLDVSFSHFSEKAIYLSDNTSIFDDMEMLEYMNLRETNFSSPSFLTCFKGRDIVINNLVRLDFSNYHNIRLIMGYQDDSLMDISKYIGN